VPDCIKSQNARCDANAITAFDKNYVGHTITNANTLAVPNATGNIVRVVHRVSLSLSFSVSSITDMKACCGIPPDQFESGLRIKTGHEQIDPSSDLCRFPP
jgi:hypothetical protein